MAKHVISSKKRVAEIRRSLISEGYRELAAVSFGSYWVHYFRHPNGNRIKIHVTNDCLTMHKNGKNIKTEKFNSGGTAAGGKSACPPAT